jgi:hypothetical protein
MSYRGAPRGIEVGCYARLARFAPALKICAAETDCTLEETCRLAFEQFLRSAPDSLRRPA